MVVRSWTALVRNPITTIVFTLLLCTSALAAPGGVSADLQLWLKADTGTSTTTDGALISTWTDQSPNAHSVVADDGDPTFQNSGIETNNFFPSIKFDGDDDMKITSGIFGTNTYDDIYVFVVSWTEQGPQSGRAFYEKVTPDRVEVYPIHTNSLTYWNPGDDHADYQVRGTAKIGAYQRYLLSLRAHNGTPDFVDVRYDGLLNKSEAVMGGSVTGINNDFHLGSTGTSNRIKSNLSELIFYLANTEQTVLELQKIESYLAFKYGIELDQSIPQDYLASDGTTEMWDKDATNASTYNSGIAGIGRDDGSPLVVVQSTSAERTAMLTITAEGEGTNISPSLVDIADLEFFSWGHNGDVRVFGSTEVPGGVDNRLNRVWLMQETGDVGSVSVTFELANTGNTGDYKLLIDADGDFSNATIVAVTPSISGDQITFSGVTDIDDAEYFTLASTIATARIKFVGGAYDISAATYVGSGDELRVYDEEVAVNGMAFNTDGSKLFVIGTSGDSIVEYDLSSPFDVSTAVHLGIGEELSVSSQESSPIGFAFSSDGMKLFVVGSSGDAVVEYDLATAFDVSTGVYAGASEEFSVKGQDNDPRGLTFTPDGSALFVAGNYRDSVYRYDLGVAYDVSTAVYAGLTKSLYIGAEEATSEGLVFHPEGTYLYVIGSSGDNVVEYELSIAFDLSTVVYAGASEEFRVASQESAPKGVQFNANGSRLYVPGTSGDAIVEYLVNQTGYPEASANDGSIDNTSPIVIELTSDTFQDIDGDDILDVGSEVTVNNIPAGLTPVMALSSSDTVATLTLTGNATDHQSYHDVADITFVFDDSAFTSSSAADVIGGSGTVSSYTGISFSDNSTLVYAELGLNEVVANDGEIQGSLVMTIVNDTFSSNVVSSNLITASNVPAGLTVDFNRDNQIQITMTLTGKATNHADVNDVANLTVSLLDGATVDSSTIADVLFNSKSDLVINFDDSAVLSYSNTLAESTPASGILSGAVTISLSGDTFAADVVSSNYVSASNVPAGLTAVFSRDTDSLVTLTLAGTAASHANADDIANLTVTFADGSFVDTTLASNVDSATKSDLVVDFVDSATLNYVGSFAESTVNDGSISGSMVITIPGDTFTANVVSGNYIQLYNVPAGLSANIVRDSNTQLTVILTGNALLHEDANDINNIAILFTGDAFTSNTTSTMGNSSKIGVSIDFTDPASLGYVGSFSETAANDGSLSGSVVITLTDDTLVADAVSASRVTASNVPAGLAASFVRDSAMQITLTLTGNATNHLSTDDIDNLSISFADGAFSNTTAASDVIESIKSDVAVSYSNPASVSYSGNFSEAAANDGSITGSVVIALVGDTFVGDVVSSSRVVASNLPAGLAANFVRDGATQITLTLTSNATSHVDADDIANLTITFTDGAYSNTSTASDVTNYYIANRVVDFDNPVALEYSGSFTETAANDGSVSGSVAISLSGDTFVADIVSSSRIVASNMPTGLTAVFTRNSNTLVTLTLTGKAATHIDASDIANLTVTFVDGAFDSVAVAANVSDSTKSDLVVDFNNATSLAYVGSFTEAVANDGSVSGSIVITLSNDTFSADVVSGSHVQAFNLPAGLNAVFVRDNATQITLTMSSSAGAHTDANDITNLSVVFADDAFVTNSATAVSNSSKIDIAVDFDNAANIGYAGSIAELAVNDGSVGGSLVLTLSVDTYVGDVVSANRVTASNIPIGLTANFVRDSATQITLVLTGNATSHADSNDISNLTVNFSNGSFSNTPVAANVSNSNKNDLLIDFIDPAVLAYVGSFTEIVANDGSVVGAVIMTLANDTFVADVVSASRVLASNVPTGLTALFVRDSASQLTLTLSGNATDHTSFYDVADLTVSFNNGSFAGEPLAANVLNSTQSTIAVAFDNTANLSYSGSFAENAANDGSVSGSVVISLSGDTLVGDVVSASRLAASNVPAGLVANFVRDSATQITLTLAGNATNHTSANDITNVTITFSDGSFVNTSAAVNVSNSTQVDRIVDFNNPVSLGYSGNFVETAENTGALSGAVAINLSGDTFVADVVSGSRVVVSNVPAGLTAALSRVNDGLMMLTLTGTASNHLDANDIANLTLTFADGAFTGTALATNVSDSTKSDLVVDFNNASNIVYVGSFTETATNDGSVAGSVVMTLTDDTFAADVVSGFNVLAFNSPAGLSANLVRDSATQITLTLTGNANVHADVHDINNLSLVFSDDAFVINSASGVSNNSKTDIVVDFSDAASLAYVGSFSEAATNDGDINGSLAITVTDDSFVGDVTSAGRVTATNVPPGLVANFVRFSATQVTLWLTGAATNHLSSDDVSNISISFADGAFANTNLATNVSDSSKSDVAVGFNDVSTLAYSGSFSEWAANDGSVTGPVIITLTDDVFVADVVSANRVVASNVPAGLTAVFVRNGASQLTLSLTGNATSHTSAADIANLTVSFNDGAFNGVTQASNVANSTNSSLSVSFNNTANVNYAGSFIEVAANDGSVSGSLVIGLTGDTFVNDVVSAGRITAANLPTGMVASFVRDSGTQLSLTLVGGATNHENANDTSNVIVSFDNGAFTTTTLATNVGNSSKADISVDFIDTTILSYNGSFTEAITNNGSVIGTLLISLTNDSFVADVVSAGRVVANNVPAGLTPVFVRDSATQLSMTLTGNASAHTSAANIGNLSISFGDASFVGVPLAVNVLNSSKSDIVVTFNNAASLDYSGSFSEVAANDGSVSGSVVIGLTGDTLVADVVSASRLSVSNIPVGLTAVLVRDSATQLTLTLTGNATNHGDANDVDNLTLAFNNGAFVSTANAVNVSNSIQADRVIDFNNSVSLGYSGSYIETASNTGLVSGAVAISLSGDSFVNDVVSAGRVIASNVPAGLAAVFTRNSNSLVTLALTGNATSHVDANDIANLTVTFANGAFITTALASNVSNATKTDLVVDFNNATSLAHVGSFTESIVNDGSVSGSLVITLSDDTFTADVISATHVQAFNLPSGLAASFVRGSATQLTLSLTGNANAHTDSNDINNLSVVFADDAFVINSTTAVSNSSKTDIAVDFVNAASLVYVGSLKEVVANDGSVNGSVVISLSGDTLVADVVNAARVIATNVPPGLVATFVRDNASQLTLTLTGNASDHASSNDISNLTVAFADGSFTSSVLASNVSNSNKNDLSVDFSDVTSLAYVGGFSEVIANDGSMIGSVVVTLTDDTFVADVVSTNRVIASNVPVGLTAVFVRDSATQLSFTLTGNASSHTSSSNIANLTVSFSDGAFIGVPLAVDVNNSTQENLVVAFNNTASLDHNGSFVEASTNDGAIAGAMVVSLVGDTFVSDVVSAARMLVSNVPAGLSVVLVRDSATQITLFLAGTAFSHSNASDISNLTVSFADGAFTSTALATNVSDSRKNNVVVNFNDPASLVYSGGFIETLADDGLLSGSVIIMLSNDNFSADVISGGKISISNMPVGLTANASLDSNTQITLTLNGSAFNHDNSNDVSDLTVSFSPMAFVTNATVTVVGYLKSDLAINFLQRFSDTDFDGDGLPNNLEVLLGSDLYDAGSPTVNGTDDTDGNGVTDAVEMYLLSIGGSSDTNSDLDNDGLADILEIAVGGDPLDADQPVKGGAGDSDGDGISDGIEGYLRQNGGAYDTTVTSDSDGDQVPDIYELTQRSDPFDSDSPIVDGAADDDIDGVGNALEYVLNELGIIDVASNTDTDGDGVPDMLEIMSNSDPQDVDEPILNGAADDDADNVSNGVEAYLATLNIFNVDATTDFDRDGIPDVREVALGNNASFSVEHDDDGDGISDVIEYQLANQGIVDIDRATDTDSDGLPDWFEIVGGSDPLDADSPTLNGDSDSDGDGVSDALEAYLSGVNNTPERNLDTDSDGDSVSDIKELLSGSDPFVHSQPVIWVNLSQADHAVQAVDRDGGDAIARVVVGNVITPVPQFDWSNSDQEILSAVTGSITETELIFDPSLLDAGNYNLAVSASRTIDGVMMPTTLIVYMIRVADILDDEVAWDADSDGIVDSSDPISSQGDSAAKLQTETNSTSQYLMSADDGVDLRVGSIVRAANKTAVAISLSDISAYGDGSGGAVADVDDGRNHSTGIFDFEIANLPKVGASARVVLPLKFAIPEQATYRKFDPALGWRDFVEDEGNEVASAPGLLGDCPGVDDSSYQPGLTEGYFCVRLTIVDGGPNDADGLNGLIKDPGGVTGLESVDEENASESGNADLDATVKTGTGGGVMDIFMLLIGLFAGLVLRSSRR